MKNCFILIQPWDFTRCHVPTTCFKQNELDPVSISQQLAWAFRLPSFFRCATRPRRAWAQPHSLVNLPMPENLLFTWGPPACPSAPQGSQCSISHFLANLRARENWYCTSMLWSIDSCENRVSADHYHLTVSRVQVSIHRGQVFCWSYLLTS